MKTIFRYVASISVLLSIWGGFVFALSVPPYLLPSPIDVGLTLLTEWPRFLEAAIPTFSNALFGGALGISAGIGIGASVAFSKKIGWLVEPYLTVFQSFPREALFPIIVVWAGFGDMPKVINAALLSVFPMAIVTLDSLRNTQYDYLGLMQSWSASNWQIFRFCRLPAAVPAIVGGIRVAAPLALIGSVLGEFLGSSEGLGYIIVSSGSAFRTDLAFAAIVTLALGGMMLVLAVDLVKQLFLKKYFQT